MFLRYLQIFKFKLRILFLKIIYLRVTKILEEWSLIVFPFADPFKEKGFLKLNISNFLHSNFCFCFIVIKFQYMVCLSLNLLNICLNCFLYHEFFNYFFVSIFIKYSNRLFQNLWSVYMLSNILARIFILLFLIFENPFL